MESVTPMLPLAVPATLPSNKVSGINPVLSNKYAENTFPALKVPLAVNFRLTVLPVQKVPVSGSGVTAVDKTATSVSDKARL